MKITKLEAQQLGIWDYIKEIFNINEESQESIREFFGEGTSFTEEFAKNLHIPLEYEFELQYVELIKLYELIEESKNN